MKRLLVVAALAALGATGCKQDPNALPSPFQTQGGQLGNQNVQGAYGARSGFGGHGVMITGGRNNDSVREPKEEPKPGERPQSDGFAEDYRS